MTLRQAAFTGGPGRDFKTLSAALLREYGEKIRIGLDRLTEEQAWWRPNPASNSAGNLVLHVCGNLSLWVVSGIGGEPYDRDRAGEFAADRTQGRAGLLKRLDGTIERCCDVIPGADLARRISIQGYDVDGLGALYHAVEHAGYHTGQILYIVKQLAPGMELYPQHGSE